MVFKKRKYDNPLNFLGDLAQVAGSPSSLAKLVTGSGELTPAFREKIMLAVTSVNQCRYCSFFHGLIALKEGASRGEVRKLLDGIIDDVEEHEREALLYGIHWADSRGNPSEEARQKMIESYGEKLTEEIEFAIRSIMLGNYTGNTVDFFLNKASFGWLARG